MASQGIVINSLCACAINKKSTYKEKSGTALSPLEQARERKKRANNGCLTEAGDNSIDRSGASSSASASNKNFTSQVSRAQAMQQSARSQREAPEGLTPRKRMTLHFTRSQSSEQRLLERRKVSVLSTSSLRKVKSKKGGNRINQYKILRTLGKGAFATVLLCSDVSKDNLYAIKQMSKSTLKKKTQGVNKTAYDCVVEELKVL